MVEMEELLEEKRKVVEKKEGINESFVSNKPKKYEFIYNE